jgi:hypothetical protein
MLNLVQHDTSWSNLVRSRIKSGMTNSVNKNPFWTRGRSKRTSCRKKTFRRTLGSSERASRRGLRKNDDLYHSVLLLDEDIQGFGITLQRKRVGDYLFAIDDSRGEHA